MRYDTVLFDLDGTLTDSSEGIVKSLQHALKAFGIERERESLLKFIGPPIQENFVELLGKTGEPVERAVKIFRERYERVGYLENRLYEGVPEMLCRLRGAGLRLCVATSKPQYMAEIVLRHFEIYEYFDFLCGSSRDGALRHKPDIIRCVLEQPHAERGRAVMVGDRYFDLEGARQCGIDSIGVTYGFGSEEELIPFGPVFLAETPARTADFLLEAV